MRERENEREMGGDGKREAREETRWRAVKFLF